MLGNIGVDYFLKHEFDAPVTHLQFLINEVILYFLQDKIHNYFIFIILANFGNDSSSHICRVH